MVLVVVLKNDNQIYEDIRTTNVDQDYLVYYRTKFYAGERHKIEIENIKFAYIIANDIKIHLRLDNQNKSE